MMFNETIAILGINFIIHSVGKMQSYWLKQVVHMLPLLFSGLRDD
jgi:hypothetical protein